MKWKHALHKYNIKMQIWKHVLHTRTPTRTHTHTHARTHTHSWMHTQEQAHHEIMAFLHYTVFLFKRFNSLFLSFCWSVLMLKFVLLLECIYNYLNCRTHNTIYTLIYLTHIVSLHFNLLIPLHTKLSIVISVLTIVNLYSVIPYLLVLFFLSCSKFLFCHCRSVALW